MNKTIILALATILSISNIFAGENYKGSSAEEVWSVTTNGPYSQLPSDRVGYKSLFDGAISLIERSANRTINDQRDVLPYFTKLAHPNGICLKGEWIITEKNPYTGLFKKDTEAIIIARASVALNDTEAGKLRGFGLAGKLFRTTDNRESVKTSNFFLIDDLGGTNATHYTDVEMTNEPKVSKTWAFFKYIRYALKISKTFKQVDSHPTMRQVYEISENGLAINEKLVNPKWMMVKASSSQLKVDEVDFRNELAIENNHGKLSFDIYVASTETKKSKDWLKIGMINFYESSVSSGCDHQLHFHHAKWRTDLE